MSVQRYGRKPTRVFISYAREDARWLEELKVFLKRLERDKLVSSMSEIHTWDDSLLRAGEAWEEEIVRAISEASVAVLLISQVFFCSDFVLDRELPLILDRAENDGLVVMPVLVEPSTFQEFEPLSRFQAINDPWKTLAECRPAQRKRVWIDLVKQIRDVLLADRSA